MRRLITVLLVGIAIRTNFCSGQQTVYIPCLNGGTPTQHGFCRCLPYTFGRFCEMDRRDMVGGGRDQGNGAGNSNNTLPPDEQVCFHAGTAVGNGWCMCPVPYYGIRCEHMFDGTMALPTASTEPPLTTGAQSTTQWTTPPGPTQDPCWQYRTTYGPTTYSYSTAPPATVECPRTDNVNFTGAIWSANYPNNYPNNLNCNYDIVVPEGMRIVLRIAQFDTEQCCDRLAITDGGNSSELRGGMFHNLLNVSTDNTLYLQFYTDGSVSRGGFYATYEAIPADSTNIPTQAPWTSPMPYTTPYYYSTTYPSSNLTCQPRYFNAAHGVIMSPNYPNGYYNRLDCYYYITAPPNKRIQLTVHWVFTESCCDYLKIDYDGMNYTLRGRQNETTFASVGNTITLQFYTDSSVTDIGFIAQYAMFLEGETPAEPEPPGPPRYSTPYPTHPYPTYPTYTTTTPRYNTTFQDCPPHYYNASQDVISSPGYPNRYANGLRCTYHIEAPPGMRVALFIEVLDTESCCDSLNIMVGGADSSAQRLAGFYQARTYLSQGNTMVLEFATDGSVTRPGFAGFYTTFPGDGPPPPNPFTPGPNSTQGPPPTTPYGPQSCVCPPVHYGVGNGTVAVGVGRISSPGYPASYCDNMDCTYEIAVAPGSQAVVEFDAFHLEGCCDYVTVLDARGGLFRQNGVPEVPITVVGESNHLTVRFTTDGSVTYPGFSATFYSAEDMPPTPVDPSIPMPPKPVMCECPQQFHMGPVGIISTPPYLSNGSFMQNGDYCINSMNCHVFIEVAQGMGILLQSNSYLNLYPYTDAIMVFEEMGMQPKLRIAGQPVFKYHTKNNRLRLYLQLGERINDRGFQLSFVATDMTNMNGTNMNMTGGNMGMNMTWPNRPIVTQPPEQCGGPAGMGSGFFVQGSCYCRLPFFGPRCEYMLPQEALMLLMGAGSADEATNILENAMVAAQNGDTAAVGEAVVSGANLANQIASQFGMGTLFPDDTLNGLLDSLNDPPSFDLPPKPVVDENP